LKWHVAGRWVGVKWCVAEVISFDVVDGANM